MKKRFYILYIMYAVVGILSLTTAACSSDKEEGEKPSLKNKTMEVAFSISVPGSENASDATRIPDLPDPGTDTGEHDDWDRLTVIIAYTQLDMKRTVYYDTFTKDEFYSNNVVQHQHTNSRLLPDSDNDGYHEFMMSLPIGKCRIYGVTYTEGKGFDPVGELKKISDDGKDHNGEIIKLQISNDYAKDDGAKVAKFISVATGYAINTKDNSEDLQVSLDNIEEMKQYWRMQLNRLAAKVDIQWDAQSAYEKNTETGNVQYTDVKINSFSFCGGATDQNVGAGSGYLFPTLAKKKNLPAISGKKDFINTSEISRRNGRVYHYTFPDGHAPKITFKLVTSTGVIKDKESNYTFDLKNVTEGLLLPATWYKINVKVTGKEKQESIIIDSFK
ncbi:hypothetical protein [uncultured Prevotella sp.]|uniref:hypothetical protein n=1 Tax=uncultured Prevotella sp. TaxID=159272 RepID=UPI002617A205|nr:hypothetical protein [uncultured Prevotella sp.]